MSRQIRPGGPYVAPIKSDGSVLVDEKGRGNYTLEASTTYYFPLGGKGASIVHAHLQWDANIILTTVTVEECDFGESDVSDHANAAGDWLPTSADRITSTVEGAGATVTADVIDVAGGAAGGGAINIHDNGASRLRLAVVVAGTGGVLRVATHGKG